MSEHHSSKSISFLMELIFVLFFFTIASAIAVFVLSNAKEKNDYAQDARNAIFYGENLIETQSSYLHKGQFYMDDKGNATTKSDRYKVRVTCSDVKQIIKQECTLDISRDKKQLVTLTFLSEEEETYE